MNKDRFSRQSFLGEHSQGIIERTTVGIVGLGGGGSHIAQQLAHIGFLHYVIYDPDIAEDSNLNRLVGATEVDVPSQKLKVDIARRIILGLRPQAKIEAYATRWQNRPEPLRKCDIIFGCLDGFAERSELEACARRYLIPLIDIGMGVHYVDKEPPRMGGQIIISMPDYPCMRCLRFLNEVNLAQEAAMYGDAGVRPQVVWANGVLASMAVGLAIDILTDWTKSLRKSVYLEYDGNNYIVKPDARLEYLNNLKCPHHTVSEAGDPTFTAL